MSCFKKLWYKSGDISVRINILMILSLFNWSIDRWCSDHCSILSRDSIFQVSALLRHESLAVYNHLKTAPLAYTTFERLQIIAIKVASSVQQGYEYTSLWHVTLCRDRKAKRDLHNLGWFIAHQSASGRCGEHTPTAASKARRARKLVTSSMYLLKFHAHLS